MLTYGFGGAFAFLAGLGTIGMARRYGPSAVRSMRQSKGGSKRGNSGCVRAKDTVRHRRLATIDEDELDAWGYNA